MLKTRVITAILALIPMIWVFLKGDLEVIRVFFTLLVLLSAYEIGGMLFPALNSRFSIPDSSKASPAWLLPANVILATVLYASVVFSPTPVIGYIGIGLLAGLLLGVFGAPSVELSFAYVSGFLITIVYSVFPWVAIEQLYERGGDARYVFLLCAVVWCGDTGAYFAGRSLGRHKLAPRMSPNKTWEGAIGGICASLVGGLTMKSFYGDAMASWSVIIACCLLGGMFGQLGDLTESTFKRFSGVKDSGKIFPGHGGFLDRVDGLLFAAPVIWFILYQFGS